ncbi:hypothetical protein PMI35_04045 [Pseudomonas sp. GM78]|nr:hypothetical protein PMI35_04045 [Pseudomonas sp. GM78]
MQPKEHPRYELTLLIVFVLIVIALGYSPRSRVDWALENLLALLLVGTLVVFYHHFRLSAASLTLVFVFLCIHELGAITPIPWCPTIVGVRP